MSIWTFKIKKQQWEAMIQWSVGNNSNIHPRYQFLLIPLSVYFVIAIFTLLSFQFQPFNKY